MVGVPCGHLWTSVDTHGIPPVNAARKDMLNRANGLNLERRKHSRAPGRLPNLKR